MKFELVKNVHTIIKNLALSNPTTILNTNNSPIGMNQKVLEYRIIIGQPPTIIKIVRNVVRKEVWVCITEGKAPENKSYK